MRVKICDMIENALYCMTVEVHLQFHFNKISSTRTKIINNPIEKGKQWIFYIDWILYIMCCLCFQ